MARIGIFGGSFNPPHNGHIRAARQCVERLALDRLLLVPDAAPPHKALAPDSPSARQRYEMVQLAARDIPRAEVSDIELRRSGKSYTVDTLRELQAQYPKDELLLLMGTDMFLSFDRWRAPDEIVRIAQIVCMHRRETDEALRQQLAEQTARLTAKGAQVVMAENDALELSSTTVRRMLAFDCAERYLPPDVLAYIRENGLYGTAAERRGLGYDALRAQSLALHDEKRVPHAIGTSELAKTLGERYGADAALCARAGILHDVTKALRAPEQLALCERYAIPLTPEERENPKLLHAITGAAVARNVFGECELVTDAIRWHTTGRADMRVMEKILYIADYAEPTRDFPGVERLRAALERSLDEAVLLGLSMTMEQLRARGQTVCHDSLAAHDFLSRKG